MRQLYNFKIGVEDDPVEKLFEMEDLHVKRNMRSECHYPHSFPRCLV